MPANPAIYAKRLITLERSVDEMLFDLANQDVSYIGGRINVSGAVARLVIAETKRRKKLKKVSDTA